jgi:hypothetical protein
MTNERAAEYLAAIEETEENGSCVSVDTFDLRALLADKAALLAAREREKELREVVQSIAWSMQDLLQELHGTLSAPAAGGGE